jgi:hypothetical protein
LIVTKCVDIGVFGGIVTYVHLKKIDKIKKVLQMLMSYPNLAKSGHEKFIPLICYRHFK